MIIKERVFALLQEKPRRVEWLFKHLPDVSPATIQSTISSNQKLFVRLRRGLVGVHHRDTALKQEWRRYRSLPVHKRIVNLLRGGPMPVTMLCEKLPDVKPGTIQFTISNQPDLFLRVKKGWVGRRNRDEWMKERYER